MLFIEKQVRAEVIIRSLLGAPLKRCSEQTNCEVRRSYSMKSNQTATIDVSTLGSNLDGHLILILSQQIRT